MPYKSKEKKAEYNRQNFTRFVVKLHNKSDETIIGFLKQQTNKNDYIRQLIKADMEKEKQ